MGDVARDENPDGVSREQIGSEVETLDMANQPFSSGAGASALLVRVFARKITDANHVRERKSQITRQIENHYRRRKSKIVIVDAGAHSSARRVRPARARFRSMNRKGA